LYLAAAPSALVPGLTAFTQSKLTDPAKFNGKSHEVQPYIASVMERLDGMGTTSEVMKIIYFSLFLSQGSLQQWHNSIHITNLAMFKDWNKYVKAFEAHFSNLNRKKITYCNLRNLSKCPQSSAMLLNTRNWQLSQGLTSN
jgi:hypothetical protein